MEHINSDGEEDSQHDSATHYSISSSAELGQDDRSGFTVSELKMEFEKMCSKHPSMLDAKQENDSCRCHIKSCPCGNKLGSPNYLSFVSPHKDFPERCIGSGKRSSDSLSIFYRTPSLFSIPVNLRSSRFSFESQNKQRGTKCISNGGDFIIKCSPAAASGDVNVSPSGRWIFKSTEANVKVSAILESSLLFQLSVLDGKRRPSKSVSADTGLVKCSELSSLPSRLKKTIQRRSSELNVSERKLVSCSSTNSTCSYISASSADSFSKGLLCCFWKGRTPYFVLSLDNDGGDIYVAYPQKVESSVDKALDYVYLFWSRNSRKHHTNASGFVGKMNVSSSLTLNSDWSKLVETEFVLFGCREDYFKEMESSSSTLSKSKGFSKKVADIFRSSRSFKNKVLHKFGEPGFQFDDLMWDMSEGELRDLNEVDNVNYFIQDFPANLELAAIVVKDCPRKRNKVATGGWGLKFLEKVQVSDADNSEESSFSCKNNETDCKRDWGGSTRRMSVLVPAGFHGGPIHRTGGPSSLAERWKSGGHCDCGGWDLGCPLTVLESNSVSSATLIDDEPEEDCQPICLFVEVRCPFFVFFGLV